MDDEQQLRRSFFRGYRPGDVELALARAAIGRERVQVELDATKVRVKELQSELDGLRDQLDGHRRRESELLSALDEMRSRREALEREARARADEVLGEAVQRAAELRTEGLRQVGELQQQVEQLFALRSGLGNALQRALEDITESLERLTAAPARVADELRRHAPEPPESRTAGDPAEHREQEDLHETLARFSTDAER